MSPFNWSRHRRVRDSGDAPPAHASVFDDDPTTPLEFPRLTLRPPLSKTEPAGGPVFEPSIVAVAEVVGPLHIPQITVGEPSYSAEPCVINADFRSYPYRPDAVIDGWSTAMLTVRGVSQRGHLHRYNGAPRQDEFAVHHISNDRVIVVVADGVSAARQSHLGATAAVKQAANWLRDSLGEDLAQTDWLGLMKNVAWSLSEQAQNLFRLAEPDPVRAETELATTLVCAVVEPLDSDRLRAYLVGVGDSGAWLLSSGVFTEILGSKAVSGVEIASSAVTGLPWVPKEIAPVVVEVGRGDVLLVGTDGIGDPLGTGQSGVGNLLRAVLCANSPPSLIEFAHAVDFSRENFDDDRTLVAVWPRQCDSVSY
jgi:Protein phosphatase 2C